AAVTICRVRAARRNHHQSRNLHRRSGIPRMSTKHRILVVGVGSIGERHTRCFLATERTEVGICEPSDALRQRVADEYPVCGSYASLDEALQQSWTSAVIASPAHTHMPLARQVAQEGIAPFIEKPL